MRTVVIQIDAPTKGEHAEYPVRLYLDEGDPTWHEHPIANGVLPVGLRLDPPAVLPGVRPPIGADEILDAYARAGSRSDVLPAIGRLLFRLIDRGDVAPRWNELRSKYPGENPDADPPAEGLRFVFDVRPPELAALPWELIDDGLSPLPLSLLPGHAWIRGPISVVGDARGCNWPLVVLIVVGCAEDDIDVKWREERDAIIDVLRAQRQLVEWHVEERPDANELATAIHRFKPHVFHFIGHGLIDPARKAPVLVCEQKRGTPPAFWDAGAIMAMFGVASPLRFAFINACRTSTAPAGLERGQLWGLVGAFFSAGARAVIGMRGDISGAIAASFARSVYSALARHERVDIAVAQARRNAFLSLSNDPAQRDWSLPCFEARVPIEQVLPFTNGVSTAELEKVEQSLEADSICDFFDRKDHRLKLWSAVDPPDKDPGKNLVVVRSPDDLGKSALLRWCLHRAFIRKRMVLLVDLGGIHSLDWLGVLRAIVKGDPTSGSIIRQPFDRGDPARPTDLVFARFHHELNKVLDPAFDPDNDDWDEEHPRLVKDSGLPLTAAAEKQHEDIFGAFRECLAAAAEKTPIILAFDHLLGKGTGGIQPAHFEPFLWKFLIGPIGRGEVKNVRLILAARDTEWEQLHLAQLRPSPEQITLGLFPLAEFVENGVEFFLHRRKPRSETLPLLNDLVKPPRPGARPWIDADWKAAKLRILAELATT